MGPGYRASRCAVKQLSTALNRDVTFFLPVPAFNGTVAVNEALACAAMSYDRPEVGDILLLLPCFSANKHTPARPADRAEYTW